MAAMVMLIGGASVSEAARQFGHKASTPRVPAHFTAPTLNLTARTSSQLKAFPRAISGAQSLPSAVKQIPDARSKSSAVRHANAGGTNLFGLLNYSKSGYKQGWYEFTSTGIEMIWQDPLFTYDNGFEELATSWVKGDLLCGYTDWYQYGYLWGQKYYELNINTGEVVTEQTDEDCIDDGGIFISTCYDPEENVVYGYSTDDYEAAEITTANFQKTKAYPWGFEVVKEGTATDYNNSCKSLAYNPIDKNIYGITLDNRLVKIDKATGNQTLIAKLNSKAADYVTGMCYSTAEGKFYWNPAYADTEADIVSIDPKSGAITVVQQFNEGGESFGLLAEIGSKVTGESPLRPEIVGTDFGTGANSGTITIKMPTTYVDGRPISKQLKWTARVDNREYKSGNANAGAEVAVKYDNLTDANHTFAFYCELDGQRSAVITTALYIGSDTPASPANVVLEKDNIHWTAVKTGVNGGYIDPASVQYEVYLDGKLLETTGRTSVKTQIGAGKPYARHQAYVRAVFDSHKSAPAYSNYLNAGEPWELPVDIVGTQEQFDLCTSFNLDGEDENWWEVDPNRDPEAFYAGQADDVEGNDWLILPAMNFPDANAYYSLYVSCMSVAAKYDSKLEVCIGQYPDPTSMDQVLIPAFQPQSRDYATYSNLLFKVPYEGEYYIGLHAITGKNSCGVMVHEVRVENNNLQPNSPSAVTDLKATPGANGALEATVSFKMPVNDVSGNPLAAGTQLTAKVSADNTVEVSGTPGQECTATVKTVQGENRITVALSAGSLSGASSVIDVFTGVTIPGTVKNMKANIHPDMMGVDLSWDAPDPEKAGGCVDTATTDYYLIYGPADGTPEETHIGTGINEYVFNLPSGAQQNRYRVGIEARNVAGTSGRYMAITSLLGTPYSLPLKEDFESEELSCGPWVVYASEESQVDWFAYAIKDIATEWKDMDGYALCGVGEKDATDSSALGIPRFSTLGMKTLEVKILAWTGEQSAQTKLTAALYGTQQPEAVGEFPYANSDEMSMWKTLSFQLPAAYLGKDWVQLYIDAAFGVDHNYVIIDSIEIGGEGTGVIGVMNADGSIFGGIGCITVKGFDGKKISVYTLDGRKEAEALGNGETTEFSLSAGVYMVKAGDRTAKILVR